ncbi:AAA family ATPase [Vibrio crassostreae]|uniref:AAA family ATPase n=1 Tax=Vibrio crassostreae TaxID=246167 RepID=UPI001B306717|nr:AAA family ATPase [Vibrio crassostreae]
MSALVIAVVSQKGGTGKSTITSNLAVKALNEGKKTLVCDCDPQASTYYWVQERNENPELSQLNCIQLSDDVRKQVESMKNDYDLIILDCLGSAQVKSTLSALMSADIALSPIRPKRRDLATLEDLDELIHERVEPLREDLKTVFCLSQCPTLPSQFPRILGAKDAIREFGFTVLDTNIHTRNVYDDTEETGRSVLETSDKKAIQEITELYNELMGLV